jgi:HK97 family phage portal protein
MAQFEMGPSGEMIQMASVPIMTPQNTDWLLRTEIHEPYAGAWQQDVPVARRERVTAFGAVYACLSLIAGDISKLPLRLLARNGRIWEEAENAAYSPVLRKPNRVQTTNQWLEYWVLSKFIYGNAYQLKQRDRRGVVEALYPLHPECVEVRVSDDGDVYYALKPDNLAGIDLNRFVPASEIVHDLMNPLFHPLCGVSPLYACALTVTQGQRIQNNSAAFFQNMSRPSGQLTAPGRIDEPTADRLKRQFETEFSRGNVGRLLVTGNGLKYEPMTIPARDAQLIDQLKWTAVDVCGVFHVPPHKLGIGNPTVNNAAQYNVEYFSNCVQRPIQAIESLLADALSLAPREYKVDLDEENLLRMDQGALMDVLEKGVRSTLMAPNEGREKLNLPPVKGGAEPLAQQQVWPLSVLAERPPPTAGAAALPAPAPAAPAEEDETEDVEAELRALLPMLPTLVQEPPHVS